MIRHAFITLVAALALSAAHAQTNQYTIYLVEEDMSLPNLANGCAAWGDVDQDGFMDLFFSGRNTQGLFAGVYRNVDGVTYSNMNVSIPGGEGSSADWGDFDNDGDLDLIYCAYTTNQTHSTYLYRNDGNSLFTEITNHPFSGVSSGSIQWGDYDQDGLSDVALCGYQSGGTNLAKVYRNLGSGLFSTNPITLTGVRDGRLIWHDFNGDGFPDLLLHGDTGNGRITKLYRNENGTSFTNLTTSLPGLALGCVDWVDFDCDGDDDLSLTGYAASGPIGRLYRAASNAPPFTLLATNVPPATWLGNSAWGDYDNDGDPDLVVSGINTQGASLTHLYLNEGSGTLTQVAIALPPQKQSRNQWVDLNGDDILDLFMCGRNTNGQYRTYAFLNYADVTNTPPTAPANLSAVLSNDTWHLTWEPAEDVQTSSNGLRYNLFAGTATNRGDLVSPLADIETGRRHVICLPNRGKTLTATLPRLPSSTPVYWGVQAVDVNGLGGPFAFGEPLISPPLPDLTIAEISCEEVPLLFRVVVSNAGPLDAEASLLAFWLDCPASALGTNGADRLISVAPLAPGASIELVFADFPLPSALVTNTVRAFINADGAIREETVTNNQHTFLRTTLVYDPFVFSAAALLDSVSLRWTDPEACGLHSRSVHLRGSYTAYPATLSEGFLLYEGTNQVFSQTGMTPQQTCYYTIWVSHDGTSFIMPP